MKLLAFILLFLSPLTECFSQDFFVDESLEFDTNKGFPTAGIENSQDWHEPQWTEFIVRSMGLDTQPRKYREVITRSNKLCDICTQVEAIEVEWVYKNGQTKWYEAPGQAVLASLELRKPPSILLLSKNTDRERREIELCAKVCAKLNIRLYVQQVP